MRRNFGLFQWNGFVTYETEVLALLSKVPSPPGEKIPQGASEQQIAEYEKRIGIAIPTSMRRWLVACNGPCVGPGGIFGMDTPRKGQEIADLLELHPHWREKGWIPIAGDGCGNYFVVATKGEFGRGEPVLFIETTESDSTAAYIAASDTWQFLRFLLKKELGQSKWPFHSDEVVTADPNILSFHNVDLPWNA